MNVTVDLTLPMIIFAIGMAVSVYKYLELLDAREMGTWAPETESVRVIRAIDEELVRLHKEQMDVMDPETALYEQRNKLHDTLIEIARRSHDSQPSQNN